MPQLHEPTDLTIRNDLAELPTVSEMVDRIGAEAGMPPRALMQLQVALDEILSNVIKYAWPDGGAHALHVSVKLAEDAMEVVVIDDGRPFEPRAQAPPEPPPLGRRPRPGGVGIHMVRQLVDDFNYARVDGHNRITVTKRYASDLPQHERK